MRLDLIGSYSRFARCLLGSLAVMAAFSMTVQARSLQDILRAGLNSDPGILEAEANERVAESRLAQTEATRWPTVVAKGNQSVIGSGGDKGGFQPALEATWTVYDFGKRDARIRRDEIRTDYFSNKTDETAQEFMYELAGNYLEALKAKMLLEVAKHNLARHQEILRKIGIIVEYDPGRRSEMTQAEARLLQVRENIINYERMQALALSRIARYVSPPVTAEELQNPFSDLDIDGLLARYPVSEHDLRQNPSYVAQSKELESLQAELETAELSKWPDVNLVGEAKRRDSGVYLSLAFDVFDAGKTPVIDEKRYQVDAAKARLDKIAINLLERAQVAILQMREDQQRINIADSQISASEQVASDYEDQFQIAQRSLLDVLNAYGELAGIEQVKALATSDLMNAKLDYLSAAGKIGDWAGMPGVGNDAEAAPKVIIAGVNDDLSQGAVSGNYPRSNIGQGYIDVNQYGELMLIQP